jgi:pyruvate dehydrogenase E1 component alpha subunit
MEAAGLVAFENKVAAAFEARKIRAPIHLVGGNEDQLISIFKEVKPTDWVLSTWRSHYHALLHGVPEKRVMAEIFAGRSMMLHFPEYRFMTSAIMGGMLPIACGLAAAGNRVWCFVGDMAAASGMFHEVTQYAHGHVLPVTFVVEDNGLSTNTPTERIWKPNGAFSTNWPSLSYKYQRTRPHCGSGVYVAF